MRKSKEDWLEAGLKTLAQDGLEGLTIQRLAHRLRLTKGSFYHHFVNISDYKGRLIAYWAEQTLSKTATVPGQPLAGLALLDDVIAEKFGPATEPEVAIRAWAQQDEQIRRHVERVDQARRNFIFQIFLSLTGDVIQAGRMADLLFALLIGGAMALPGYSPERAAVLYGEFKRLYGIERV